jgi:hypothetical protein
MARGLVKAQPRAPRTSLKCRNALRVGLEEDCRRSGRAGAISPLRQRMIEDMCLRKRSEKAQSGYIRWVKHFAAFLGRSSDTVTAEDLRRYQLHLSESGVLHINLNAAITALRFLFEVPWGAGG